MTHNKSTPPSSIARFLPGLLCITCIPGCLLPIKVPGPSARAPLTELTPFQQQIKQALINDVRHLSEEIGERNIDQNYPENTIIIHGSTGGRSYDEYVSAQLERRAQRKPDGLQLAEAHIVERLQDMGYEPFQQAYFVNDQRSINIAVTVKGNNDQTLIIGAHYDSEYGCPGANDNATGVAVLLAIADAMKDSNPEHTLEIVFFPNEEMPFSFTNAMGSVVYASYTKSRNIDLIGMISLDELGYYSTEPNSQHFPDGLSQLAPDTGDFLAFICNHGSYNLLNNTVQAFRQNSTLPSEGVALPDWVEDAGRSDHGSFWMEDYKGLMVTDTANFRDPYYHTPWDTMERLDFDRLTHATSGLIGAIAELTKTQPPPQNK